jgi:hypothetical protein
LSNYTKSTNFATKDNLTPGDPLKVVRGTEIDTEFNNIATAVATKTDNSAAAITGGTIDGATVGATTPATGAFTTLAASGTTTLAGALVGAATQAAFNTVSTTLNLGGAATALNLGAATGTATVNNTTLAAKAITASTTLAVTGTSTLTGAVTATAGVSGPITSSSVSITGGSITGITDLAVADGGTGASTAASALNNLLPSQTGNASKYLQTDGTNATWDAVSLSTADITGTLPTANGGTNLTSFTSGGVVYASSSSALATGSALTFDGAQLGVNGITVGRGAGAVSTNTAVGASALAANTTGLRMTAVGYQAGLSNVTNGYSAYVGYRAGANVVGDLNVAIGDRALEGASGSTVTQTVAIGQGVLAAVTTGNSMVGIGYNALAGNTSGTYNVAVGQQALFSNTTASQNTAVGYQAGYSNLTGPQSVYVGYQAGYADTVGFNTIIGYGAGSGKTTGDSTTIIGRNAGAAAGAHQSQTLVGDNAGNQTTGSNNTFLGINSGNLVTTGTKNTILGSYSGNQGSLDIRTLSNYLVLSDGDGNPRIYHNGTTVVIPSLPTSATGLPTGGLWNDSGTLKVA